MVLSQPGGACGSRSVCFPLALLGPAGPCSQQSARKSRLTRLPAGPRVPQFHSSGFTAAAAAAWQQQHSSCAAALRQCASAAAAPSCHQGRTAHLQLFPPPLSLLPSSPALCRPARAGDLSGPRQPTTQHAGSDAHRRGAGHGARSVSVTRCGRRACQPSVQCNPRLPTGEPGGQMQGLVKGGGSGSRHVRVTRTLTVGGTSGALGSSKVFADSMKRVKECVSTDGTTSWRRRPRGGLQEHVFGGWKEQQGRGSRQRGRGAS